MSGQRDIDKEVAVANTILPALRTASVTGSTVDLLGFRTAMFVVQVGDVTDGTYTFAFEESDDNSSWGAVAGGNLSGSATAADSTHKNTLYEVGYLGSKRYIRCSATASGSPATGGTVGAVVIRGGARTLPQ